MAYAALGLTILGLSGGLMSRLKVLLVLVCAVFLLSVGFSLRDGFSFLETVAVVVVAQAILQSCYLLGVVIHTLLSPSQVAQSKSETEAMDLAANTSVNNTSGNKASIDKASADAFGRPSNTRRLRRPYAQGTVQSELSSRRR